MDIRTEMTKAIEQTANARRAASMSRESKDAYAAYANAAAGVTLRKIVGFEVTIDGEKRYFPPEDVMIIFPAKG